MSRMLKYRISANQDQTTISIRAGADIRAVGVQLPREVCLWAEVPDDTPVQARTFTIIGTGDDVPAGAYVGTVFDGPFVWHIYEVVTS
jgi:hypothetical protein